MKIFTSKINNKPYNRFPNFWCVKLFPLEQSPGDLLSSSSNNWENQWAEISKFYFVNKNWIQYFGEDQTLWIQMQF